MRSLMLGGLPRPVWLALWMSVALLALLNLRSGRPGNRLSELEVALWVVGYLAYGVASARLARVFRHDGSLADRPFARGLDNLTHI